MANKKITELDAITTLASTDVVPVVDVSADTTNKITAANLFRTLPDGTAAAPALAFSSDAANGVYLAGTDTVGISTGGTQRVTVDGSGNVTISGDLTVSGATTTVESTTVTIDDKNIELGSVATPTDTTADGGGITLKGATDKEIKWVNSTGYWTFNTGIDVGGNIEIADNSKIQIGTGNDLKLFHDGTNSEIDNETGNLLIANKANDADVVIQSDNSSGGITTYVRCDGSEGQVKLYHYGTQKLNTKSDGVDITGELQVSSGATDVVADFASSDANAWIQIRDNSTTDTAVMVGAVGDDLRFRAGSNERARIDSSGRLLVGHSSSVEQGGTQSLLQVAGDGAGSSLSLRRDTNGTASPLLLFGKSRSTSVGGNTVVQSGDSLGLISFCGADGTDVNTSAAFIRGEVDGTPGSNDMPGRLTFSTTADGASSPTERMRIDSSGTIKLTAATNNSNQAIQFGDPDADNRGLIQYRHGTDALHIYTAASEQMRIDSDGRLLVGSSSELISGAEKKLQITHADAGAEIVLGRNDSSVVEGNVLGALKFVGNDGGSYQLCAKIEAEADGTHANNDKPTRLVFSTTADGANTPSERVTIDSSGNLNLVSSGSTLTDLNFTASDLSVYARVEGGKSGSGVGDLRFHTYSGGLSEAMRIDSSGRLMLGTTTEGVGDADELTVATSGNTGITIRSGSSSSGNIFFSDATSGTDEYDGYIQYRHNDRALRFATQATERFRITSTGAWAIEGASNYGTSGQVLTSNGNDAPTWQDAGAASVGGATAISMNDSVKINFGNSNDLQIHHDGTHSRIIDNGSGSLLLETNGDTIQLNKGTSENMVVARIDGPVELYHNANKKLETKSDGVDITGELQCDTLDVDGNADINGQLDVNRAVIRDNGANSPLLSVRSDDNGPWAMIVGNDTYSGSTHGMACFQDNDGDFFYNLLGSGAYRSIFFQQNNGSTSRVGIEIDTDSSVNLRYQGSVKLQTKSDGVDVTGEVQCDSLDVDGSSNFAGDCSFLGGAAAVQIEANSDIRFVSGSWTGDATKIQHHSNKLYIQGGSDGILFRASNGSDRARFNSSGHFRPEASNTYDLGTSTYRWRNVYTNDLNLSNEGSTNDVDGTWGNYTIQEGEDDLFLINRRNGKKYKFNLTEVS